MRPGAVFLALYFILAGSGCLVVGAAVAAVSAVAVTTVKTAGKVTVATVETTGRVAAAVSSSGEVTALSRESAAGLARAGRVVVVEGGSGATTNLPWAQGMKLTTAAQAVKGGAAVKGVNIFRDGRMMTADLKQARAGELALQAGDVVELRR